MDNFVFTTDNFTLTAGLVVLWKCMEKVRRSVVRSS